MNTPVYRGKFTRVSLCICLMACCNQARSKDAREEQEERKELPTRTRHESPAPSQPSAPKQDKHRDEGRPRGGQPGREHDSHKPAPVTGPRGQDPKSNHPAQKGPERRREAEQPLRSGETWHAESHRDHREEYRHRRDDGYMHRPWGHGAYGWNRWDGRRAWQGDWWYWNDYYYWSRVNYRTTYIEASGDEEDSLGFREAEVPESLKICFPPSPLPLGGSLPLDFAVRTEAPGEELADFVYEPFYAPLSTRLLNGTLHQEQREQLTAYSAQRQAQLESLRQVIALHAEDVPEARLRALEDFNRTQEPVLRALEAEAETIRAGLPRRGLAGVLLGSGTWEDRQDWTLRGLPATATMQQRVRAQYLVLRASAFYQDGLSRAQRLLLREVTISLGRSLASSPAEGAASPQEEPFFFSPECAQLILPADMPVSLREQFSAYAREKQRLKDELVPLVFSLELVSDKKRRLAFEQYRQKQAPQLEVLEAMAEQIRQECSRYPELFKPQPGVRLPAGLRSLIEAHEREMRDLSQGYASEFEQLNKEASPAQVQPLNLHEEGVDPEAPQTLSLGMSTRLSEERRRVLRGRIQSFNEANLARYEALKRQESELENQCAAWLATEEGRACGLNADGLLASVSDDLAAQEAWAKQVDYRNAVLLPGLGIEQRRLLFGAAVAEMKLPAPPAE